MDLLLVVICAEEGVTALGVCLDSEVGAEASKCAGIKRLKLTDSSFPLMSSK